MAAAWELGLGMESLFRYSVLVVPIDGAFRSTVSKFLLHPSCLMPPSFSCAAVLPFSNKFWVLLRQHKKLGSLPSCPSSTQILSASRITARFGKYTTRTCTVRQPLRALNEPLEAPLKEPKPVCYRPTVAVDPQVHSFPSIFSPGLPSLRVPGLKPRSITAGLRNESIIRPLSAFSAWLCSLAAHTLTPWQLAPISWRGSQ